MRAPPGNKRGRRLSQPAPSKTSTTAIEVLLSLLDMWSVDAAEAAEQFQYELHQVDKCFLACPWCIGWWTP
jgi:hypothetical protein